MTKAGLKQKSKADSLRPIEKVECREREESETTGWKSGSQSC